MNYCNGVIYYERKQGCWWAYRAESNDFYLGWRWGKTSLSYRKAEQFKLICEE